MPDLPLASLPGHAVCEQARRRRDARFDGLYFTAVTSTRTYCRPECPAPSPKPENIRYFPSAAAAESAGFHPCPRCRPELAGDVLTLRACVLQFYVLARGMNLEVAPRVLALIVP